MSRSRSSGPPVVGGAARRGGARWWCEPNSGPGRRNDCNRRPSCVHPEWETGLMSHENLLDGPAPTLLPADGADADARDALTSGSSAREAVPAAPSSSLVWAILAEHALADDGDPVAAYAYARTGYHRGLDALRRAGWKGRGPVPWSHEPNRGFLRALHALEQ